MGKGKDKLKSSALRSAWMEISLANILHNVKEIQKIAGKSKIIAMVKADAMALRKFPPFLQITA